MKAEQPSFSIDCQDPLARFLGHTLKLDWLKLWFVAVLIYGPVEKLLIPAFGGYLDLSGGIREWTPHVESLLTGFVEFPFFLAFYLWTGRGIPNMFDNLARNKCFTDGQRYEAFLERVKVSFNNRWWSLLSVVSAVIIILLMNFIVWGPDAVVPPWFGDRLYARLISLVLVGFVVYAIAQTLIRETLTILWLRRLWDEMGDSLVIHPYHADGAGGLDAIGQHTAAFFYFVIVLLLFIVMATILPGFLEGGSAENVRFTVRLWSPLIVLIWVVYLVLVPFLFILLISPPHQAMSRLRNNQLNQLSDQLDQQLAAAEASIIEDQAKLEDSLKKIKNLKQMRTVLLEDFPTWPISKQTRRQFNFTSIVPMAYSLLMVVVDVLQ